MFYCRNKEVRKQVTREIKRYCIAMNITSLNLPILLKMLPSADDSLLSKIGTSFSSTVRISSWNYLMDFDGSDRVTFRQTNAFRINSVNEKCS